MIIKEFRVIIPMSVEEYQIGQLYTIQKKSRLETTGAGSGVEIIENQPYEKDNERGQYTLKVYHVDERLPAGLKTMSKLLFPKSALLFEEESWNCYPSTRTKYSHKLFKSFNVDIESKYLADLGQSDNVFNLSPSELSQRTVDMIDIVNDPMNPNEYKTETDPQLFVSAKTGRGPLNTRWLDELKSSASSQPDSSLVSKRRTRATLNRRPVEYMCCYKLCRIECAFWGCQSRVEKLISESVLRHMIFISHREAWCWQDEYHGLTMQDVRELEAETQRYINAKMRNGSLMEDDLAALSSKPKAPALDANTNVNQIGKNNNSQSTLTTSETTGDLSTKTTTMKQSIKHQSPAKQIDINNNNYNKDLLNASTNLYRDQTNNYGKKSSIVSVAKSIEDDSGEEFEDFPPVAVAPPVYDDPRFSDVEENEYDYDNEHDSDDDDDNDDDDDDDDDDDEDDNDSMKSDEFFDAISQISFNFSTNTNELDTKSVQSAQNYPGGVKSLSLSSKNKKKKSSAGKKTSAGKLKKKLLQRTLIKEQHQHEQKQQSNLNKENSSNNKIPPSTLPGVLNNNSSSTTTTVRNSSTTVTTPATPTTTPTSVVAKSIERSTTSTSSSSSSSSASRNVPGAAATTTTNTVGTPTTPSAGGAPNSQPVFKSQDSLKNKSKIDTLILVVHGGNVTCTDTSKQSDFVNFKSTMETVIKSSYSHLQGRVAYRLVSCDSICKDALVRLAALSPIVNQQTCSLNNVLNDSDDFAETSAAVFSVHESLPFNTLPLLASANSIKYRQHLSKFISDCNKIYQEFVQSVESATQAPFGGQVVLVGDSLGSLLAYDALTQLNSTSTSNEHLSSSTNSIAHPTPPSTAGVATTPTSNPLESVGRTHSTSPKRKDSAAAPAVIATAVSTVKNVVTSNPVININDGRWSQQDSSDQQHHHHHHNHHHRKSQNQLTNNNTNSKMFSRNLSDSEFVSPSSTTSSSFLTAVGNNSLLNNNLSRSSSITGVIDERLEFEVAHFFIFGSPLGLVLAYRRIANSQLEAPVGTQIYNMFHLTDPIAVRIEPLLCKQFKCIDPCTVPRYSKFPLGDGTNTSLDHYIIKHGNLFDTKQLVSGGENEKPSSSKSNNNDSPTIIMTHELDFAAHSWLTPNIDQLKSLQKILFTKKNWWGENRLDYVLYAPEKITNLPRISLPYIFHSCFWESSDVVAFLVRMIFRHESGGDFDLRAHAEDLYRAHVPSLNAPRGGMGNSKEPVEKFQKRLNRVKLKNLSANHRANDLIVLEDKDQIVTAKFSYGPLDFALSCEKVEIFISSAGSSTSTHHHHHGQSKSSASNATAATSGEWRLLASAVTDSHGRLKYELPKEKRLPLGMYQIKCVVKCDHTFVDFQMAVLPAHTEAVVFSIDGSFAANISFSGTDPKVRAGAVDVVRYWQDLGYLIIYITARPDIQHYKVTNWLAQHNFPLGMVYFSEGICRDPLRQKTQSLRSIVNDNQLKLQAGYGSSKDIPMYASLNVPSNRIFIIGKAKSKYLNHAVILQDGYASHLSYLQDPNTGCRQASGNARLLIKKSVFTMKHNTMFSTPANLLSAGGRLSIANIVGGGATGGPITITTTTTNMTSGGNNEKQANSVSNPNLNSNSHNKNSNNNNNSSHHHHHQQQQQLLTSSSLAHQSQPALASISLATGSSS